MGFSVSGAAVILLAGLLVAFGMLSASTTNGFERVEEAQDARADAVLDRKNTAIVITEADWNGAAINFDVENTGSRTIRSSAIDVVVDGSHEDHTKRTSSDIIRPGETADLTVDAISSQPSRITVVTAGGVADSSEVTAT